MRTLPRVGEQRGARLAKLRLFTAEDLLYWFPRSYQDLREIYAINDAPEGEPCCVLGIVAERPVTSYIRKGMELTKTRVVDGGGQIYLTFFNQNYVRHTLTPGETYVFYGTVERNGNRRSMVNPMFEREGKRHFTGRIMPVYPLTAGISNYVMSQAIRTVLVDCGAGMIDPLPQDLRQAYHLAGLGYALQNIHFPKNFEELEVARRRLVFEELFFFSAGLALMRARRSVGEGYPCPAGALEDYIQTLPFALTGAQCRAIGEAERDLRTEVPMNRLIQGDVGSGKTVVAAACAWLVAKNGYQAAMMAPTEILAEQHYHTLAPLLAKSGLRVGLLTGSMKAKEKRDLYQRLELGMVDLIVGTHALLSEGVLFRRLALVITDEQHRFGVDQRGTLTQKGEGRDGRRPHVLVMSATPIPRTLALILYGDLEVSIMDELPPGRQTIDTFFIGEHKRQGLYGFLRQQVEEGHQVYIVCPSVGEDKGEAQRPDTESTANLKAVTKFAKELQTQVFPDLRVGFLHGRLSGRAKEQTMSAFARGELDILVSTTVIEVGVDVPNATVMVVENAERFGLSQLHQLRGRVGRGQAKSYCFLLSTNRNPETRQRLKVFCSTNDGFRIAEEDLKLRGPGDFFGTRQHGLPQLRVADLATDLQVLQEAREAAQWVLQQDPDLSQPEHREMLERIHQLFARNSNTLN